MKNNNRSKIKPVEGPQTRAEMEALVREIAATTAERNRLVACLDGEIAIVKENYEAEIGDLGTVIEDKTREALAWAEANPGEFGDKKSIEFLSGTVGWRVGNPTLKTLAGWTWDRVREKLCSTPALRNTYIRVKEEVNKEALLADRDIATESFRALGVRVERSESFFVDPKVESPETRQVVSTTATNGGPRHD